MHDTDHAPELRTAAVIERFNSAFQRRDPALLESLIADDCTLENTTPAPDGARHVGREACLAVWCDLAASRAGQFELERTLVFGEYAVIQWRYRWGEGAADSVRGLNLMRVRDGLIVEGQGYVKAS